MLNLELLKELSEANGIAGHEKQIFKIMEESLKNDVDEITSDNLGSFISLKKGEGPKIMLASHMDEVGFVVKHIDDNGFIYFQTVGGWWSQVMLAQRVVITTYEGKEYDGIIGSKPPHVLPAEKKNEVVDIKEMFIDLGVSSKQEIIDLGIQPGDMITPYSKFSIMNNANFLLGKAWDNRVGCAIIVEVMKKIKEKNINANVYGVATVQEEIGLRGAKTSAFKINPDISIAIDTGIAGDTPKMTIDEANSSIGKGPQLIIMDATTLGHVGLRKYLVDIAKENNIEIQYDFIPAGGTDAGSMHLAHDGSPAISMSIATRYIHSHASIIHQDDVKGIINLIVAFLEKINEEDYLKILNN